MSAQLFEKPKTLLTWYWYGMVPVLVPGTGTSYPIPFCIKFLEKKIFFLPRKVQPSPAAAKHFATTSHYRFKSDTSFIVDNNSYIPRLYSVSDFIERKQRENKGLSTDFLRRKKINREIIGKKI